MLPVRRSASNISPSSVKTPTSSFSRVSVLFAASIILNKPLRSKLIPLNSSLSIFALPTLSSNAYPMYSPALRVNAGLLDKLSLTIFEWFGFRSTSAIASTAKSDRLLFYKFNGPLN
jgi:hypothetical protein